MKPEAQKRSGDGFINAWFGKSKGQGDRKQYLTTRDEDRLYARPESFADLLHFAYYDRESKTFQYPDASGLICGAMIELNQCDAEGRDFETLMNIRERVAGVLQGMPEVDGNCWVFQVYIQDEPIAGLSKTIEGYLDTQGSDSSYRQTFKQMFDEHLVTLSQPGGLFFDKERKARWGAKARRVRCVVYRVFPDGDKRSKSPENSVDHVCRTVISGFESAGIEARRCAGVDMMEWMLPWLSPTPRGVTDGYEYLRKYPYDRRWDDPDYEDSPASNDLAEAVLLTPPKSGSERDGTWHFGKEAHRVLTIERFKKSPRLGITCLEDRDSKKAVLMDRLPEKTVIAMTIVIKPQDEVTDVIKQASVASVGQTEVSETAKEESHQALVEMSRNRCAFPTWLSVFVRSKNENHIEDDVDTAISVLQSVGFVPIEADAELIGLASYPLNLPMGYNPKKEKQTLRTRLQWDQHLANLMPVYGASRGTGNCGTFFLNVNGGPIMLDPLNPADREMSGHSLILGPTGSGKSAMLVYLCCWLMAVHKPHLYIIDVGDSFGLLGEYLKSQGFSVNHVKLGPDSDISLPPFADAPRLFDPEYAVDFNRDGAAGDDEERRDILAEMEIAAQYLITQGRSAEENRLHAEDSYTIRNAIILAAARTIEAGREQTMIDDVVQSLRAISRGDSFHDTDEKLDPARRPRASEMADAMAVFCTGETARYFNRPGTTMPECDVTIVDLEVLVAKSAIRELIVVFMGLMNRINHHISTRRLGGRPTVVINDEAHITTKNPLMARYVVNGSKMWRKKGAWLWMATQDLIDFPDESAAILNQAEWWFCLSMTAKHVDAISRFKMLSQDERSLLLSARKKSGVFVDGVVLSKHPALLFRSVPPAMCLSLALTEQHEAAERAAIAREQGISNLEAVEVKARQIDEERNAGAVV